MAQETLELIDKLTKNVVRSPTEEKFRKVKLTNPKLAAVVAAAPTFVDIMQEMGWVQTAEGLELPASVQLTHQNHVVGIIDAADYYKKAIEDAKVAQVAVAKALTVLQEFYAGAATATALTQQDPASDAPATFSKPYTGMGGSNTGVIGMLEVIQGDFARLESETTTSESAADEEYTRFTDDSSQDKAVKNTDLDNAEKIGRAHV